MRRQIHQDALVVVLILAVGVAAVVPSWPVVAICVLIAVLYVALSWVTYLDAKEVRQLAQIQTDFNALRAEFAGEAAKREAVEREIDGLKVRVDRASVDVSPQTPWSMMRRVP